MSVKRYDLVGDMDGNCNLNEARMESSEDGVYVKYQDYAALEQQLAESHRALRAETTAHENTQMQLEKMAAENAGLIKFITQECHVAHIEPETFYWEEITRYVSADGYQPETPATNSFLAEVRAQGVDALVERRLTAARLAKEAGHEITARDLEGEAIRARFFAMEIRKGVQS